MGRRGSRCRRPAHRDQLHQRARSEVGVPAVPRGRPSTGTARARPCLDPAGVPVPPRHARHRPSATAAARMSHPIIEHGPGHILDPVVIGGDDSPVIPGVDPAVAIAMLPIRIETRFAGTDAAPQLLVRMYPDDVHLDGHDPRLTGSEISAGQAYWTSVRGGGPADQAWAQLLTAVGPTRAIWVRQALTPTNDAGVRFSRWSTRRRDPPDWPRWRGRCPAPSSFVRAIPVANRWCTARRSRITCRSGFLSAAAETLRPRRRTAPTRSYWTRACAGWSISPTRSTRAWPSRSTLSRRPRPSTRCWS